MCEDLRTEHLVEKVDFFMVRLLCQLGEAIITVIKLVVVKVFYRCD